MIRAFEGFDHVNTATDLFAGVMTSASATSSSGFTISGDVQYSGKCMVVTTSDANNNPSTAYAARFINAPTATIILGVSIALQPLANAGYDLGITNGISCHVFCRLIPNQMLVYRGDPVTGGMTLLGSALTGLPSNGWAYVEVQASIGLSGSISVFVNGSSILSLNGLNTSSDGTSFIGGIALGAYDGSGKGFAASFDDLYVLDQLGGAPNNTLLGPVRVIMKLPTGNTSVGFTPVTNTNWQQVAESNFDGDTSYNYGTTSGQTDLFPGLPLSPTTTEVFAVQVKAAIRKDDAGGRMASTVLLSGATQVAGQTVAISPSYRYLTDIYSNDPNTGTSWTNTAVNASSFGYTVVS